MIGKRRVLLTLALGLGAVAVAWLLLGAAPQCVRANPGTVCVAPGGTGCDPGVCGGTCYATVQQAVDAALVGDEVRVATGVFTGVHARAAMTQVVYISKTITLRGGYSPDLTLWDPDAYPTTLDAQRQGRVVSIVGSSADPTLQGFIITGGDATGLTLNCPNVLGTPDGCGGGVFVYYGGPIIANNIVTNNVAGLSTGSHSTVGGGLCLEYASAAVIADNLIVSNTASLGARGAAGGIALCHSPDAMVAGNDVISNVATVHATLPGSGGGIAVTGGGISASIVNNLIQGNASNGAGWGYGAGIYGWYGRTHIVGNRLRDNYGQYAVFLGWYGPARFEANQVLDNRTEVGVYFFAGVGGGPTLANNVVARSGAKTLGLWSAASGPLTATLIHNTLIGSGAGVGVSVETGYISVILTNTIIASHTWAITNTVPASSTVSADHTLFWANTHDGIAGTDPVYGDPCFNALPGGFHLGPRSAAVNAGTPTTETEDIDGDWRPLGPAPDIGADEARWRILPAIAKGS